MAKLFFFLGSALLSATFFAAANASTHDFYKNKTVRIIVGLAPGGGFDTYSQAIARHLGKQTHGQGSQARKLVNLVKDVPQRFPRGG